jgi:tripartite-type tricarboxylate transporter receptor subunit TctC
MKLLPRAVQWSFVALMLVATGVTAQTYPTKPVRVVIPWPPGGANDVAGRIVMTKLAAALGKPFPIDNRAGAGGNIGANSVAKAPPDGYTIMVNSITHVGNAHLYKTLPFDVLGDFAPVGLLVSQASVLTVHPSLPAKSVKEFIALARAHPDEIIYSTAGNGSIPHLTMALFSAMTNTKLVHVPYRGGGPQAMALLAGESQASFATVNSVLAHIKLGRLRALGVSTPKRARTLPDVPPIAEAGVPGFDMSPWIGVFAPAGTPRAVIEKLNAEMNKVLTSPDIAKNLSADGFEPWVSTPEEFAARLKLDYDKYEELVRITGAKVE